MKELFAQRKRTRCPQCLRISLERDQISGSVCRHPQCAWTGSSADGQAKWEELRALRASQNQGEKEAPLQAEQPSAPEPAPQIPEAPKLSFMPRAGETPQERQLAKRAMVERLKQLGVRIPLGMAISDGATVLTDEEVSRRDARPAISQEERDREARVQARLLAAGITPGGIVITQRG